MNAAIHLPKMQKVSPDILLPLQVLGGELLSRSLSGEPVDASLLNDLLLKPEKHDDHH
jgi:voltage-gated potassium channel